VTNPAQGAAVAVRCGLLDPQRAYTHPAEI
jgi:hypothetical protein